MADFYATNHDHGGGAGAGVTNINGLTGAVTLAAGANITITPSGNTLTIASTSGGTGTVTSVGTGTGLTGGPITTTGTIDFDTNYIDIGNRILQDTSSNASVDWAGRSLIDAATNGVLDWGNYTTTDGAGNVSIDWGNRTLRADDGSDSIGWNGRQAFDSSGNTSLDWELRQLISSSSNPVLEWAGGDVIILGDGANSHSLRWNDSTNAFYVSFQSPTTLTQNTIYELPAVDGTSGQVLTTDGAGNLNWATNGTGTVTSVVAGTGLDVGAGPGGTITTTGTLNLANTAVTAGTYAYGSFVVDAQGRLTSAINHGVEDQLLIRSAVTTAIRGVMHENASAGTQGGAYFGKKARGTLVAPTAALSGDNLLTIGGNGYGATGYAAVITGGLLVKATQTFTDTAQGTQLVFLTTPNGSITNRTAFIINQDNTVGFLNSAASATITLGVASGSASYAMTLPTAQGAASTVLTNDGAGLLSWSANGNGTVTSVVAGTGLDVGAGPGGTITTTGTLNLAATAVTPGTYTNATLTVDAQGRLTAASSGGTGADWSLAGNALTGTEFLGSTNAFDIVFKTNNVESMVLSTTLHSLKHGVVAVGGSLLADGVGSQAHGNVDATSIIDAADTGSTAFGNSLTGGTISASGFGAQARGHATDSGVISTGGPGAEAGGSADGVGSAIQAGVVGARASGVVTTGGIIDAAGDGSRAFGGAIAGGLISAADIGTLASGFADDSGVISAGGQGGRAHGYAFNTNSSISTAATGAEASGSAIDGGVISAGGTGSMAHGSAVNADSLIDASGEGATAYGSVGSGGIITASGIGAGASGIANNLFIVEAASDAAQAHGYAFGGNISSQSGGSVAEGFADAFNITAGGAGSRATGFASLGDVGATAVGSMAHGDDLAAGATYGVVLGLGHDLDSYACTVVGVYADVTGFTAASIVETDPAFVVGTGVSGTPENGFRVDKDARITTAAGLVTKAIRAAAASGDVTVDLRTDYKIIVDTSTSDGPFNINLPAGEDGLTYKFGNTTGGGTVVYNFVPDGADLVNAGISSINSGTAAQEITFLGGTWYATS